MIIGNQGYQPAAQGQWINGQFVLPPVKPNPRTLAGQPNTVNPSNVGQSQGNESGGLLGIGQGFAPEGDTEGKGWSTNYDGRATGIGPLDRALANPAATLANLAVGMVPFAGPINSLSGLLNGPTLGGLLFGRDSAASNAMADGLSNGGHGNSGNPDGYNFSGMTDPNNNGVPNDSIANPNAGLDTSVSVSDIGPGGTGYSGGGWDYGGQGGLGTFARGGAVTHNRLVGPNPPGPDDGSANLDVGEYVVRRKQAQKHRGLLDAINSGASDSELKGLL